jgi:hypothetical protein
MGENFPLKKSLNLAKKRLDMFLLFKFNLWSPNYFKLIKLNFVLQNLELTKQYNIFLISGDP